MLAAAAFLRGVVRLKSRLQPLLAAPLLMLAAGFLFADDVRLDFPSGGTLHLKQSIGELTVEGSDQPGLAITTIKPDRVRVMAAPQKDEVVVTTIAPKHFSDIEYRIKVPRNARLMIDHNQGDVHIDGVTGEIHVTDHKGQITVHVPQDGQYAIDARAKLGAIDSDFPGREERKLKFGHTFVNGASPTAQKMYLRIGFGDITILAIRRPPSPK
jgi:hypothetical protein